MSGEEKRAPGSDLPAPGEETKKESFSRAWELMNETPGNGYPLWDLLPWPPEPPANATNWPSWPSEAVAAYLQALGDRQRKFETEALSRLDVIERHLVSLRTWGHV